MMLMGQAEKRPMPTPSPEVRDEWRIQPAGAGEKARRKKQSVDLTTARRMLPLVQRIVTDIVHDAEELNRYTFEQEGLDRNKTDLSCRNASDAMLCRAKSPACAADLRKSNASWIRWRRAV